MLLSLILQPVVGDSDPLLNSTSMLLTEAFQLELPDLANKNKDAQLNMNFR